ncbi:hypothetical protein ABFX02_09G047500 [Erythranthe guttata]
MIGGRSSYDSDDSDVATAIAASAHAIHSLEETANSQLRITMENSRKQEPYRPPQQVEGSIRKKASIKDTRSTSFMRPPAPSFADHQRQKQPSFMELRRSDAKADSWERAHIAKIRKRYEKMTLEILAWENEKKLREKHQMERKKGELELRKSRNWKHYQSKVARIDEIGGGARAQVEAKRKKEESIVKNKANQMRSTGKVAPVINCFCF